MIIFLGMSGPYFISKTAARNIHFKRDSILLKLCETPKDSEISEFIASKLFETPLKIDAAKFKLGLCFSFFRLIVSRIS